MRDMARRPERDRGELFRATAQAMRVHEAIVEKDFWVCWILDYLFQDSPWKDRMAFKGGTSLSKAYGAIERFSEDIDLILEWQLLGYSGAELWEDRSPTKQDAFGKEANQRTAEFLARDFAPVLIRDLKGRVEADIQVVAEGQDVFIQYPRAFSLEAIHPQIRLEIGPLAAWVPNEGKAVRPYAAERFPRCSHNRTRRLGPSLPNERSGKRRRSFIKRPIAARTNLFQPGAETESLVTP